MANTDVTLINNGGVYIPSAASVPVVSGDSVSFKTDDGSAVFLFFSPQAASVLSPTPSAEFEISGGGKAIFFFTSASAGAYSVYFGSDKSSAPTTFSTRVSQMLLLEVSSSNQPSFTGPGDKMTSGH